MKFGISNPILAPLTLGQAYGVETSADQSVGGVVVGLCANDIKKYVDFSYVFQKTILACLRLRKSFLSRN